MPHAWHFACARQWLPDGDPLVAGLGGTEQAILGLTAALTARGHPVTVSGAAAMPRTIGGVEFTPTTQPADITVAINDALLLPQMPGFPAVWFHNEVGFAREWRKGRLPALRRHRPAAIFIGSTQAAAASRLLAFRARATIPYGLPAAVLDATPTQPTPPPHALFTSQAYRGLAEVIALWRTRIAPALPQARLTAHVAATDVPRFAGLAAATPSISIRPRIANAAVLDTLRSARVLIVPGHRSETFCLAAAEAIAMGVPVATLGIGSLRERVTHGRTGRIARTWSGLGADIVALLADDTLWATQHAHCLATRADAGWDRVAQAWENFVDQHIAAA